MSAGSCPFRLASSIEYLPEKVNNPGGFVLQGSNSGVDHMGNWMECTRSRKQPNANVETAYGPAIAAPMSDLPDRKKVRITLEGAMAKPPEDYWKHA
jgi:hypothetical protein